MVFNSLHKIKTPFWFFLAVLSLLSMINLTYSCSCRGPRNTQEKWDRSSLVFSGLVINTKWEGDERNKINMRLLVNIAVKNVWKGNVNTEILTLETNDTHGMCGVGFELNKSYIIYTDRSGDGRMKVHLCSGTKLYDQKEADELGEILKGKDGENEIAKIKERTQSGLRGILYRYLNIN